MRGIISAGGYVPYHRLPRAAVAEVFGGVPGKGRRAVASYDEDTTTMGVEAARVALAAAPDVTPGAVWFSTADPVYLDKTNATAIHAALRLDREAVAADFGGAVRSGVVALRAALEGGGVVLVVSADVRVGLPTSAEEAHGGDGAAAVLVGDDADGPVIAELVGAGAATAEVLDRWRTPGERRSKVWEERFGETQYLPLADQAWRAALKAAGVEAGDVDHLVVTGSHPRAVARLRSRLGVDETALVDDLAATTGNTGTAHPALLLSTVLERAAPGDVVAMLVLADGADALVLRATDAIAGWRPIRPVGHQVDAGGDVAYGRYLSWRGLVTPEPPRRPPPDRVSAPAAARASAWKYGFVGGRDPETGDPRLPPDPGSAPLPMADVRGTIATFTVDRLAWSPSPPVVFAVVDFDGGGRFPMELTDADPADVAIGGRVEMTFRRLTTADGIANYFWKGRPVRGAEGGDD